MVLLRLLLKTEDTLIFILIIVIIGVVINVTSKNAEILSQIDTLY